MNNPPLLTLKKSLGREETISYSAEIYPLMREILYFLWHLKEILSQQKGFLPVLLFPGYSKIVRKPKGKILIIGPFNYPINLSMIPLVEALTASNKIV